jgi:hypothetical protein
MMNAWKSVVLFKVDTRVQQKSCHKNFGFIVEIPTPGVISGQTLGRVARQAEARQPMACSAS